MSTDIVKIVSTVNLLLELLRQANLAAGPVLEKIKQAQAEGKDLTDQDLLDVAAATDAAKKKANDSLF